MTLCKRKVQLLRQRTFETFHDTSLSGRVGSTFPWTLLAAILRGPLSPDLWPSNYILVGVWSAIQGASAWSSCLLSALTLRCVIAFHGCLSRQTELDMSSSHPCTELHDQVTLHGSSTSIVLRLNMKRRIHRTPFFVIFVMEGHSSTICHFESHFFGARRNKWTLFTKT